MHPAYSQKFILYQLICGEYLELLHTHAQKTNAIQAFYLVAKISKAPFAKIDFKHKQAKLCN